MSLPPSGPPNPPEPEPTWLPEPEAPVSATSALPPYDPQFGPRPYETAAGQATPYGQQPYADPQYAQPQYGQPQQPQYAQPPPDPFAQLYAQPAAQDPHARPAQPPAEAYGQSYEPQYPAQQVGQPPYAVPAEPRYGQQYAPQDDQSQDGAQQYDPQQADPYAQYGQQSSQQYAQPAEQYEGPHYSGPQYADPYAQQPGQQQEYRRPQYDQGYGQQEYGRPQYDQGYGQQEYAQPQYGQQYAQPQYAQPQYGHDHGPADQYGRADPYDPYARQQQQFADPFPLGGGQQPPYYPPDVPRRPHKTGTNGFAIAGFVFSLIGGLLFSVVFSVIGLRQIRRDGGKGRGLAVAGLVLSGLWVVGIVAVVALGLLSSADRGTNGEVVAAGDVALTDLQVGDCVEAWSESDSVTSVRITPCANPHDAQVVSADALPAATGAKYPGDASLDETASQMCTKTVDGLDDTKLPADGLSVAYFRPLADSWKNGDRTVTCLVVADAPMKGTVLA